MEWKKISAMGAATSILILICFRHDAGIIATVITLAYVAYGVGLLMKAEREELKARKMEEKNREILFDRWVEKTNIKANIKAKEENDENTEVCDQNQCG